MAVVSGRIREDSDVPPSPYAVDVDAMWQFGAEGNWSRVGGVLKESGIECESVVDPVSEERVARIRRELDSGPGGGCPRTRSGNLVGLLATGRGAVGVNMLKRLLALGVDPDGPKDAGETPCHVAGFHLQAKMYWTLVVCRPNLDAVSRRGCTLMKCVEMALVRDDDDEKRRAQKRIFDVLRNVMYNGFPTIAELASNGVMWAVKNLCRRRVIPECEISMLHAGKNVFQWVETRNDPELLEELRYLLAFTGGPCASVVASYAKMTGTVQKFEEPLVRAQEGRKVSGNLCVTSPTMAANCDTGDFRNVNTDSLLDANSSANRVADQEEEVSAQTPIVAAYCVSGCELHEQLNNRGVENPANNGVNPSALRGAVPKVELVACHPITPVSCESGRPQDEMMKNVGSRILADGVNSLTKRFADQEAKLAANSQMTPANCVCGHLQAPSSRKSAGVLNSPTKLSPDFEADEPAANPRIAAASNGNAGVEEFASTEGSVPGAEAEPPAHSAAAANRHMEFRKMMSGYEFKMQQMWNFILDVKSDSDRKLLGIALAMRAQKEATARRFEAYERDHESKLLTLQSALNKMAAEVRAAGEKTEVVPKTTLCNEAVEVRGALGSVVTPQAYRPNLTTSAESVRVHDPLRVVVTGLLARIERIALTGSTYELVEDLLGVIKKHEKNGAPPP